MKKIIFAVVGYFFVNMLVAQEGLYLRTQFWSGSSLEISWLYFTKAGVICKNPAYGINPFNLKKELELNQANTGKFTVAANKMTINWGNGKSQSLKAEFNGTTLKGLDGGICTKAKPFSAKFLSGKTYSGSASAGAVSQSTVIEFKADGSFTMNRSGSISGSGNTSGAASSQSSKTGKYTVTGNTIVFKYSDGTEWCTLAQPYDLGNDDIILNDKLFKKK
jgi:hypothetical protein